MDWQEYFQPHILSRGYEYYRRGLVKDVKVTDTAVSAVVKGSEDYMVQIDRTDDDEFDPDMYCTCPYADGGNLCKHMAAVLFQVEDLLWPEESNDEEEKSIPADTTGKAGAKHTSEKLLPGIKRKTPADLVQQADEKTVRSFLLQVLKDDEKLAIQFENLLYPATSSSDVARLKRSIDKLLNRYGEQYGFLDYEEADSFCDEASEFLSEHSESLMDNDEYLAAFELSEYIFLKVASTEMDDSSGCLGDFIDQCRSVWEDIYEQCDAATRDCMFNWCEKHLDGSVPDYIEDEIESFYKNCFDAPEYLKRKLVFADSKIAEYKADTKDSFSVRYGLSQWVMYRLRLMEELGLAKDEQDQFAIQHWALSSVRMWAVRQAETSGDTDTVIHIYEQSLKLDEDSPGLLRDYALALKDLYKTSGKTKAYISMLWDLELKYEPGDLEIYREMKQNYKPEDWEVQREIIFSKLPGYARRDALYYEDGLYDRLLTCCLEAQGLQLIRNYKAELAKRFPDEVLQKYVSTVEYMAQRTGSRSHYQELVGILRQIRTLPGGKEAVLKISARWRDLYRNRPAMMDELKKL